MTVSPPFFKFIYHYLVVVFWAVGGCGGHGGCGLWVGEELLHYVLGFFV